MSAITRPIPPHVDIETWRRFCASVVVVPDGCHLWTGAPSSDGYGLFWALDRPWRAHRFAWFAWHGELDSGDVVVHRCDQPMCAPVTLAAVGRHLRAGTVAEVTRRVGPDRDRVNAARVSAAHRRRISRAAHRAIQAGTLDAVTVALSREAEADAAR